MLDRFDRRCDAAPRADAARERLTGAAKADSGRSLPTQLSAGAVTIRHQGGTHA
jgi:hypothetical protein